MLKILFALTSPMALTPAMLPPTENPSLIDVTEVASQHRAWADVGHAILITPDVKAALVDWTDDDALRADTGNELDPEIRLDNLFAQGSAAVRNIRAGASADVYLAEYFDRAKRGNPRLAKIEVRRISEGVVIDFP